MNRSLRLAFSLPAWLASSLWAAGNEVKESRATPWTPEESLRAIVLESGRYAVQLVAAEPLITDPVEMCWDAHGHCYVVEMRDYPLGGPDGQPLSRIRRLFDDDGNGQFDRAETFADHLDHAQGLLPHQDGFIVTTRTQVLFLRDTDGDGRADERRPLIAGFNPSFSQLQIASPRWGLDGAVYFNNGLDSAEIYPAVTSDSEAAASKLNIARHNLRWDPSSGTLSRASGFGQFGAGFDDWGRHFSTSNRTPIMLAVLPQEALELWPASGLTQAWEAIAPSGPASRIYPLAVTHTTSEAHSGTNTSACGLTVYRGDLMPELRGSIFVCDPTGQLITRYHPPKNKGTSLITERIGQGTEFFRSRDEWCRPVNLTVGPDGALYMCDIYRRFIDHARFFPESFINTHDMRAGEHQGRIWRIVPANTQPRPIESAPRHDLSGLIRWLRHDNAWQRETAQRLLRERAQEPGQAEAILQALRQGGLTGNVSVLGKIHFLWTWAAAWRQAPQEIQAKTHAAAWWHEFITDAAPELIENTVLAAFRHPQLFAGLKSELAQVAFFNGTPRTRLLYLALIQDSPLSPTEFIPQVTSMTTELADPWFQAILVSRLRGHTGCLAEALINSSSFSAEASPAKLTLWKQLAAHTAKASEADDWEGLLRLLQHQPGQLTWWKPPVLQGLAEGLTQSGNKRGANSLSAFLTQSAPAYQETRDEIRRLLSQIDAIICDDTAPLDLRLSALPLLGQRSWEEARPLLQPLLTPGQPPALSEAAFTLVKQFGPVKAAPLIFEIFPTAGPKLRQESVAFLCTHLETQLELFRRMEKGEIPSSLVDAETRWHTLQPGHPELNALAAKLFQRPSNDRAAVIDAYMPSTTMKGNATKGRALFEQRCMTCHTYRGRGAAVGPDISDTRARDKAALLSDILDPNRMVEARWTAYRVETRDGRSLIGLIEAETAEALTLRLPGGSRETLPHASITKRESLSTSLMPIGLETDLSLKQMADLLAFLAGEGAN